MLDLFATIYLAWLVDLARDRTRRALVAAAIAIAVARGVYVMRVEHRGAPIATIHLRNDNWTDAMRWIARTPPSSHVLADPGHAWKYGTSVRVAAERE